EMSRIRSAHRAETAQRHSCSELQLMKLISKTPRSQCTCRAPCSEAARSHPWCWRPTTWRRYNEIELLPSRVRSRAGGARGGAGDRDGGVDLAGRDRVHSAFRVGTAGAPGGRAGAAPLAVAAADRDVRGMERGGRACLR